MYLNLKKNYILILLILIGGLLRLYNLNWDQGYYLHPDERLYVAASSISLPTTVREFFSVTSPLNPHMFYYGEFPLFVYKVVNVYIPYIHSFLIVSRLVSALCSTATIYVLFLLTRELFFKKVGLIAAFLFTFSAGSIQHAHFNTTESILVLLLTLVTYISVILIKKKQLSLSLVLGLLLGMSYATKIVGLTFAIIPFISFVILFFKKKSTILWTIPCGVVFITSAFFFAPYQIIDKNLFQEQQIYMQGVTYGQNKPPFVIIYENTFTYLYQFLRVFPFTFGFVAFPISIIGFLILVKRLKKNYLYLFVLLFPLLYFAWSGTWYAKFSRYYILLIPFFSIWGAVFLDKLNKKLLYILLFLCGINGLLYIKVYIVTNTRITASEWIYNTIPSNTVIAGEHWDDNLPLILRDKQIKNYIYTQLAVYNPDSDYKIDQLATNLEASDYFILSSRRVYYSIQKNYALYPLTSTFYEKLFKDKLGFTLVKKFTNYPFLISDDFADESFQSYDHPPVLIFKNTQKLSKTTLKTIIENKE